MRGQGRDERRARLGRIKVSTRAKKMLENAAKRGVTDMQTDNIRTDIQTTYIQTDKIQANRLTVPTYHKGTTVDFEHGIVAQMFQCIQIVRIDFSLVTKCHNDNPRRCFIQMKFQSVLTFQVNEK
jgi:hypothetical protein